MIEPGVYFGLDEDRYHAYPALSNSGIRKLMVSTLDFWATSFMNPDREDPEQTIFMTIGKAYHKRILEGGAAFYELYAPKFEPEGDELVTSDDIKGRLKDLNQPVGGAKLALIERLLEADPGAQILQRLEEEYAGEHVGKTFLEARTISRIEIAAAMIEQHPDLKKCFTGGYPEVSIFWIDEETGVPMKSRLDYLKTKAVVDLKTFGNAHRRPVDRAITQAMANERYHIQAAVYLEAVEAAKRQIRAGRIHVGAEVSPPTSWLDKLVMSEQQFIFVFQQTGTAPVARGKLFPKGSVYGIGVQEMRTQMEVFKKCRETFGDDPWVDMAPITSFDDMEFPLYMTESANVLA